MDELSETFQQPLGPVFLLAAALAELLDLLESILALDRLDLFFQFSGQSGGSPECPRFDGLDRDTTHCGMLASYLPKPALESRVHFGQSLLLPIAIRNADGAVAVKLACAEEDGRRDLGFPALLFSSGIEPCDFDPSQGQRIRIDLRTNLASQNGQRTGRRARAVWIHPRMPDICGAFADEKHLHAGCSLSNASSPRRYHNSPGANSSSRVLMLLTSVIGLTCVPRSGSRVKMRTSSG